MKILKPAIAAAAAAALFITGAPAQADYPDKTIEVVTHAGARRY